MTLSELKARGRKEFEKRYSKWVESGCNDARDFNVLVAEFIYTHTETVARAVKEELLLDRKPQKLCDKQERCECEQCGRCRGWNIGRDTMLTKWNTFMGITEK